MGKSIRLAALNRQLRGSTTSSAVEDGTQGRIEDPSPTPSSSRNKRTMYDSDDDDKATMMEDFKCRRGSAAKRKIEEKRLEIEKEQEKRQRKSAAWTWMGVRRSGD